MTTNNKPHANKMLRAVLVLAQVAALFIGVLAAPSQSAYAAITSAQIITGTVAASTGTAVFNQLSTALMPTPDTCVAGNNTTYTPGNDACGTDWIVRTNDDVTFQMQWATNSADTVTIVSTLPTAPSGANAGQPVAEWQSLPLQCTGAGSTISANRQTLTCEMTVASAAAVNILPIAKVRNGLANGTTFTMPSTVMTAASGGSVNANADPGSTAGPLKISSAPLYDVLKWADTNDGIFTYATGPDGVTDGWVVGYPLAVRSPYAKGNEELGSNTITLSDVLSNITVSGGSATDNAAVQAAIRSTVRLYNATGSGWLTPTANSAGGCVVNASAYNLGGMPSESATANSSTIPQPTATCTATQAGPGATISITLSGYKWAPSSYPTNNIAGGALSAVNNYAAARELLLWIPNSVFSSVTTTTTFAIRNQYTNISGTTLSGQPMVQAPFPSGVALNDGTANDTRTFNYTYGTIDNVRHSKNAPSSCLVAGCKPQLSPGYVTDEGISNWQLWALNDGSTIVTDMVVCDKVDNTKQILYSASMCGAVSPASAKMR